MARQIRNIHFTSCQFHENINSGLIVDPGKLDEFECENISLNNCSFTNPAWNINFVNGIVKNTKIIGCFFEQQGRLKGYESVRISTEGTGTVIGCDFVSDNVPNTTFESHIQISLDNPQTPAIWRLIGNHFKSSQNNNPAIGIINSHSKVTIIGNHFEFVFDDPPPPEAKRPFVWIKNGDPSSHVIHSNIGDGQVYLDIEGTFSWIDVSPGIPVTLGSPTTKGRNVKVDNEDLTNKFKVISFGTDLKPSLYSGGFTYPAKQVDYQVEVTFQWNAGSWWISNKKSTEFTISWTNSPTEDDVNPKLDWTLHL